MRYVSVRVFDILGREFQTLTEGIRAPGSYVVPFTPSDGMSSGVYHCRLVAGAFTQTKAMIPLR
jgi:hypothetical protein